MGKVKQWLMNMEEDAAEMSKLIFCLKHGAVHQDIWDRINDPNYDDGMREPEDWYDPKKNKYSKEQIELWMNQASEITRQENERESKEEK